MISHAFIILVFMGIGAGVGRLTDSLAWAVWSVAFLACCYREVTQAEYRWIEKNGHGLRANMPVLKGMKFWRWNKHSLLQTALAGVIGAGAAWGLSAAGWA